MSTPRDPRGEGVDVLTVRRMALAVNLLRGAHQQVEFDTDHDNEIRDRALRLTADLITPDIEAAIAATCGTNYVAPRITSDAGAAGGCEGDPTPRRAGAVPGEEDR